MTTPDEMHVEADMLFVMAVGHTIRRLDSERLTASEFLSAIQKRLKEVPHTLPLSENTILATHVRLLIDAVQNQPS